MRRIRERRIKKGRVWGRGGGREEIVAKALDGQQYPLPLLSVCGCEVVRRAAAPKEPMTYAVFI